MTSLLHLDSSANRSPESVSRELTAQFADIWRAHHGAAGYRYRDLAADPVSPLTTAFCALGRRRERRAVDGPHAVAELVETAEEEREWSLTRPLISEVLAAETILIGAPMYNLSVSALLKAWIDRITFPGAFSCAETGESLLRSKRVVVVCASGGAYGPGTPMEGWDFQTPYMRAYWTKQGVLEANVHFVAAEMTLAGVASGLARFQPLAERSLAAARAEVAALAGTDSPRIEGPLARQNA